MMGGKRRTCTLRYFVIAAVAVGFSSPSRPRIQLAVAGLMRFECLKRSRKGSAEKLLITHASRVQSSQNQLAPVRISFPLQSATKIAISWFRAGRSCITGTTDNQCV